MPRFLEVPPGSEAKKRQNEKKSCGTKKRTNFESDKTGSKFQAQPPSDCGIWENASLFSVLWFPDL